MTRPRLLASAPALGESRLRMLAAIALLGLAMFTMAVLIRLGSDGRFETMLTSLGVAAIGVIGYQLFVGNTGIVSFGHPAFMGLGAYAAGVLTMPLSLKPLLLPDLPAWLAGIATGPIAATLIGGLLAMAAAIIVGPAVMRLSGATAGIMTFGLLVIVYDLIRNATAITKGNQTFFGIPRSVESPAVFLVLALAMLLAVAFKFSGPGLRVRAVRDDPLAAAAAGIGVVRARMWAWCLSAFVSGVAGALLAQNLTAFSPNSFYVALVIPLMLMVVLGGMGSVAGAVMGTVLIFGWQQVMRLAEGATLPLAGWPIPAGLGDFTLGLGLLILLRLRPGGLLGDLELRWPGRAISTPSTPAE